MRKDAGLNGDLDRIPQLAWLLFLKAFDGLEQNRESHRDTSARRSRRRTAGATGPPTRTGATGEALLSFVNGKLLPYLREPYRAPAQHDPRDVLAAVFKETNNRMLSGLPAARRRQQGQRDQLRVVGRHPHDGPPVRVDAAGDARRRRRLGRVLYAAARHPLHGPAGRPAARRDRARPRLRDRRFPRRGARASAPAGARRRSSGVPCTTDLRGIEKKPLPFLLGMMNLVLHGVGQPNIIRGNALARPITQISKARPRRRRPHQPAVRRRGGEERSRRTSPPTSRQPRQRGCSSSSSSASSRTAGDAASSCRTACSSAMASARGSSSSCLPTATCTPSFACPTASSRPTRPSRRTCCSSRRPGARRRSGSTRSRRPRAARSTRRPSRCGSRSSPTARRGGPHASENERAWRVPIADIEADGYNLDLRNPNRPDDLAHRPPAELLAELIETERAILGAACRT